LKKSMPYKRCFHSAFFALLLLTLTIGVVLAPCRLAAQDAQPGSSAPAAQSQANSEKAPSQEEQNNIFRLQGPAVQWTARTLHTSPETAASIFEITNFLIIVFGVGIPLFRWLPKFLRTRKEKLGADIDSARKTTAEANARLSAIEAKLSGLNSEIDQIRAQVEAESRQDETRIKSTIQEENARIVAAAEQEIALSATQARRSLRNFAADLAIGQAAKELVLTPEADQALIAEFLKDVAGQGAPKGGQN
jgi:F-type H+-transporting ATPase subunit b